MCLRHWKIVALLKYRTPSCAVWLQMLSPNVLDSENSRREAPLLQRNSDRLLSLESFVDLGRIDCTGLRMCVNIISLSDPIISLRLDPARLSIVQRRIRSTVRGIHPR